jgi:hypothetical protein
MGGGLLSKRMKEGLKQTSARSRRDRASPSGRTHSSIASGRLLAKLLLRRGCFGAGPPADARCGPVYRPCRARRRPFADLEAADLSELHNNLSCSGILNGLSRKPRWSFQWQSVRVHQTGCQERVECGSLRLARYLCAESKLKRPSSRTAKGVEAFRGPDCGVGDGTRNGESNSRDTGDLIGDPTLVFLTPYPA